MSEGGLRLGFRGGKLEICCLLGFALASSMTARAQEVTESLELEGESVVEEEVAEEDVADVEELQMRGFAQVVWGVGLTERSITAGSAEGRRTVNVDFVPALALRLDMGISGVSYRFSGSVAYQTSLGADGFQPAPASVGETTALRSHRFVGGLKGQWLFSEDGGSLGMFLGYGMRALYSVEALGVPAFTLHGPTLAVQFDLTAFGYIELHVAPEVQLLSGVTRSLQNMAGLKAPGFAFGGEAELRVRLWPFLVLGMLYRESYAGFGALYPQGFSDRERYLLFSGHVHWL